MVDHLRDLALDAFTPSGSFEHSNFTYFRVKALKLLPSFVEVNRMADKPATGGKRRGARQHDSKRRD